MPFIYSTLSSSVAYAQYDVSSGNDLPPRTGSIVIKGGAGVAEAPHLRAPNGAVVTEVTDEELEILKKDPTFKVHMANHFITIREKEQNAEAVASDMESRDQSAQLTEADVAADGGAALKSVGDEETVSKKKKK